MSNSLRVRLLWWLLLPLAAYMVLSGQAAYENARRTADLLQDSMLLSSARTMAGQLDWIDGSLRIDFPPAALEMFASPQRDQVFFKVQVEGGRLLAGSPDFPGPPQGGIIDADRATRPGHAEDALLTAAPSANWGVSDVPDVPKAADDGRRGPADRHSFEPRWYEAEYQGHAIRAVLYDRPMYDDGQSHHVWVAVGKTQGSRDAMVQALWRPQLQRQLVLVGLAVVFVCLGLTFELSPLMKLKDDVSDRDPMQLAPLRVGRLHSELRPIVDAINQCIARLAVQVAAHRRFIADAAHQIRTPLTLLDTQLQYARARPTMDAALDEALAAMHRSNGSMVRLTNKLLLLAQAEAVDYSQLARQRLDLAVLALGVVEDLALLAQSRSIDLGAELHEAWLDGNADLLSALILNLTDNAIRYTQAGGRVTVHVHAGPQGTWLSVTDNGPGIRAEARAHVFEPFYRASTDMEGTGLGLAIARQITSAHRGEITLAPNPEGCGVVATVRFAGA